MIEYTISYIEINRRKKAYTSLIISILFFSVLFSIDFITNNIQTSIILFIFAALLLLLSRVLTFRYFQKFIKMKVILTDTFILRIFGNDEIKCFFNDIKYIRIKKTSKGYNREFKIITNSNNGMIINGLDNFNIFEQELLKRIDDEKLKYLKEPIDFDHPYFYPVFGLIVSFFIIFGIRILSGLDYHNIRFFYYSILILNFIISLYFIIARPLSKNLKRRKLNPDYIFSFCIILISLLIFMIYKINEF